MDGQERNNTHIRIEKSCHFRSQSWLLIVSFYLQCNYISITNFIFFIYTNITRHNARNNHISLRARQSRSFFLTPKKLLFLAFCHFRHQRSVHQKKVADTSHNASNHANYFGKSPYGLDKQTRNRPRRRAAFW